MTGPPAETRSGFTLEAFQTRVIDDGIAAAVADYAGDTEHRQQMREGAVAGFEACRLKTPAELALLLRAARDRERTAMFSDAPDTWWHKCYAGEVEWVCNCLSAVLQRHGLPVIVTPTMRGTFKAAEILGVSAA